MDRPVIIDYEWVRPIPGSDESLICSKCLRTGGHWLIGKHPNTSIWCAHCFLYESDWGKDSSDKIRELVEEVAKEGHLITIDGNVERKDADRILSSIVMVSKLVAARRMGGPRRVL